MRLPNPFAYGSRISTDQALGTVAQFPRASRNPFELQRFSLALHSPAFQRQSIGENEGKNRLTGGTSEGYQTVSFVRGVTLKIQCGVCPAASQRGLPRGDAKLGNRTNPKRSRDWVNLHKLHIIFLYPITDPQRKTWWYGRLRRQAEYPVPALVAGLSA